MKNKMKERVDFLNSKAFNWCVKNDFQVYIVPVNDRGRTEYKIAVRHKGITTEGRDYIYKDGIRIESKEVLGNKIFTSVNDAGLHFKFVIENLMKKYG